ncbi:MAG: 3-isopropylmalate dehydratase [Sulfobacillus benefaciens]|uniref:3-isopropylmalate dehydratase n=1 Tax=Sulfobacillus benefaciens TaxID=453960 RepID=A0A2T2XM49_9FIRM|nr:MAG: 3-isopropylmalate dehydratase [Sulfobacillus benefaciens]
MSLAGTTIVEQVLARASDKDRVNPGEIIDVTVDMAMMHDSGGPRRILGPLAELNMPIWDPNRVVLVADHYAMPNDADEAIILQTARNFARDHAITRYHELEGICHIVPAEEGYIYPGMLMVGGDSHSATPGALGAVAIPMGSTDMLGVLVAGKTWLKVPHTIRIDVEGQLEQGVMAKDAVLWLLGQWGMSHATYRALEYGGTGLASLPVEERMVLTNMAIELGAKTAVCETDAITEQWLTNHGVPLPSSYLRPQGDPFYSEKIVMNLSAIEPLVARPPRPDHVSPVSAIDRQPINQAYIGACTGAKYHDLAMAATVLQGRKVSPRVRFLIAPASRKALQQAAQDGTLQVLIEAGATILSSTCGACAGLGAGILGPNEVGISSTNRNFPGRMGHPTAQVFLASPATVAASAVTGYISDPREVWPS